MCFGIWRLSIPFVLIFWLIYSHVGLLEITAVLLRSLLNSYILWKHLITLHSIFQFLEPFFLYLYGDGINIAISFRAEDSVFYSEHFDSSCISPLTSSHEKKMEYLWQGFRTAKFYEYTYKYLEGDLIAWPLTK